EVPTVPPRAAVPPGRQGDRPPRRGTGPDGREFPAVLSSPGLAVGGAPPPPRPPTPPRRIPARARDSRAPSVASAPAPAVTAPRGGRAAPTPPPPRPPPASPSPPPCWTSPGHGSKRTPSATSSTGRSSSRGSASATTPPGQW